MAFPQRQLASWVTYYTDVSRPYLTIVFVRPAVRRVTGLAISKFVVGTERVAAVAIVLASASCYNMPQNCIAIHCVLTVRARQY